jgi:prevent-host-death family protein
MNIQDAKARLSDLVVRARQGEEVVIARAGVPQVRLEPVSAPGKRELGFMPHPGSDEAAAPLDNAELQGWYGE